MKDQIKIKSALISVYSKDGIEELARELDKQRSTDIFYRRNL